MVSVSGHGMHEMRPNMDKKPMSDPAFRKALQHCIDRKKLVDILFEGAATICRNTPITPLNKDWSNPEIPEMEYDLEKARKILKDAGYTWDDQGNLLMP